MPPEYATRLRLNDPTLAFVQTEDDLVLVEVLDPVAYPIGDSYDRWYDFNVRVRSLGVRVPLHSGMNYWLTPWIDPDNAIWVEDEQ